MKNQTAFQRTLAFIVIGIGLIAFGVAAMTLLTLRQAQAERDEPSSVVPAAADYPAPTLTLNDLDGNPRSLADYRGQVMLVNLWATWCPPCVEELPTLNVFYSDYVKDGFIIIGIDDGEELSVVKDYVTRTGLTFPIWLDPSYLSESAFGTMNLPSSYVIDRQGQVRLQWVGAISRAMLEKYVVPIIEE
jgi:cytochrome c biogenesis protein CcmG, thiol:disulfide interchange protein DsbE